MEKEDESVWPNKPWIRKMRCDIYLMVAEKVVFISERTDALCYNAYNARQLAETIFEDAVAFANEGQNK